MRKTDEGNPMSALLSEITAERLLYMITVDKKFSIGDKLPNEDALSKMLGVSRVTLREAIKMLIAKGILTIERGRGTFVKDISESPMDSKIHLSKNLKLKDLLEIRLVLEPEIACRAATRASDEEISHIVELAEVIDSRLAEGLDIVDSELAFHTAIAVAAHNDIFDHLIPTIASGVEESTKKTSKYEAVAMYTSSDHRLITDAIKNRDAEAAALAMRLHIIHAITGFGYDMKDFR